jgi:hypothetical protein
MESLKDIKLEIIRLSEAIGQLATRSDSSMELQNELKALSTDLIEKVHLLKFASHILDDVKALVEPPVAVEPLIKMIQEPEPVEEVDEESTVEAIEETQIEQEIEVQETEATPTIEEEVVSEVEEEIQKEEPIADVKETPIEEPIAEPEVNVLKDDVSLNDKISNLSKSDSLANRLQQQPIKNLKTAIGLNERFLFANELFRGDGIEYKRAIEEFNHLESMDSAMKLITHKYGEVYSWDFEDRTVLSFLEYLERRYRYKDSA